MGAIKDTHTTLSNMIRYLREFVAGNAKSLPERAKASSIISRVYVDESIQDEEIMVPLIGSLNQIYVGYVMTVLGMESYIADGYTVRELNKLVTSESLDDTVEFIRKGFGDISMEDKPSVDPDAWDWDTDPRKEGKDGAGRRSGDVKGGAGAVDLTSKEQALIAGRLVEVMVATKAAGSVPVRVYVQLVPRLVDREVAGGFVGLNLDPSIERRMRQVSTGEIGFWRDFVFSLDRIKSLKKSLQHDKTGDLRDMLERQNNGLLKYWLNLSRLEDNYNAASSVLIISKEQLRREMAEANSRFTFKDQQNFFNKSFMMMLCVVDTDYNTVDLYIHGIKGRGSYSFQEINKVGSSSQGVDLKEIMSLMSHGNMVRF